jgi:hypothetical protein
MRRQRQHSWRNLQRRLCVSLLLFGYLLTVSGFPVPASAVERGGQTSNSPVRDCACACAEQCGKSCCCCSHASPPSLGKGGAEEASSESKQNQPIQVRWVPGLSALSCRGSSTQWVTNGTIAPPPPPLMSWGVLLIPTGPTYGLTSSLVSIALVPSTPPPRLVYC